ncbi:Ethanolamine kinase [Hypoxylon texense]
MNKHLTVDLATVSLLTKLNAYEYIIVGSGFGGGILAESLARKQKKVLLIERGGIVFSTHVLNTSRPFYHRGASNSPEGNETIYDTVKSKVQCTEGSETYVGGPVYCVGGRSNLWGIWTPRASDGTLKAYFPASIASYLQQDGGYDKAFNFITDGSQTSSTYPKGDNKISSNGFESTEEILEKALGKKFDVMPVAAQFNSPQPYMFPMGAFSTTLSVMNRMYANDQYLTVLTGTEVLAVDHEKGSAPPTVTGLKVRSTADKVLTDLQTGSAKVILSAGTIGTASIALNSGLQQLDGLDLAGKGIMDHDICYVRFAKAKDKTGFKTPVNLKTLTTVGGETCLLTVTVNANFFLAGSSLPIGEYYDKHGLMSKPEHGFKNQDQYDTICVLFEFVGPLSNNNEVLNLPSIEPVLRITRPPLKPEVLSGMEEITGKIRDAFIYDKTQTPKKDPAPRPIHMGFGVFAHEAGTMRMDGPKSQGAVDENLKVKNFDNLHVCDLSVFPVCPEANPTLTLTALSLRLSDKLAPEVPPSA